MNRNNKKTFALIALIPLCFVLSGCGRLGGAVRGIGQRAGGVARGGGVLGRGAEVGNRLTGSRIGSLGDALKNSVDVPPAALAKVSTIA